MAAARRHEPVRTCVGCRVKAAKSELLRVVVVAGTLTPDPRGTSPGRGAHLHPDPACLALAERRRAFPRALRLGGPLDTAGLAEYLTTGCIKERSTTGNTGRNEQ
ncbi:MAG TPA: YlxR family protein [Mycobacteriales bacterium]|nr:YlxR family protein [Mycobacteriales bacterium]